MVVSNSLAARSAVFAARRWLGLVHVSVGAGAVQPISGIVLLIVAVLNQIGFDAGAISADPFCAIRVHEFNFIVIALRPVVALLAKMPIGIEGIFQLPVYESHHFILCCKLSRSRGFVRYLTVSPHIFCRGIRLSKSRIAVVSVAYASPGLSHST